MLREDLGRVVPCPQGEIHRGGGGVVRGHVGARLGGEQAPTREREQGEALAGQLNPARRAGEERDAEILFELLDALPERGGGEGQARAASRKRSVNSDVVPRGGGGALRSGDSGFGCDRARTPTLDHEYPPTAAENGTPPRSLVAKGRAARLLEGITLPGD